jgi:hypothetical protein
MAVTKLELLQHRPYECKSRYPLTLWVVINKPSYHSFWTLRVSSIPLSGRTQHRNFCFMFQLTRIITSWSNHRLDRMFWLRFAVEYFELFSVTLQILNELLRSDSYRALG